MSKEFQYHTRLSCVRIENSEFIVSDRVQINPDNSQAMSSSTLLSLKVNTLQKIVTLSQLKPWCNDSGVSSTS